MLEYLNETLISLIPKCQSPASLNNYRPISLCNTVYKMVTKIIVGRLRPFLDKLISPIQAAFVPGRRGLDNVVIAQELIHSIDLKKGNNSFMAIQVDLAKAYDRLEWNFIHKVLRAFHFPDGLISLIMSYISSSSLSILFNGGKLDKFQPTRGIHQGDSLSPYIFLLCMKFLGYLIDKECMEKNWIPMKASRTNVEISHLFFADDLMLFAKVDKKCAASIKRVLNQFCLESGQAISEVKSRIYFSPNTPNSMKENIYETLGIHATTCLGKYLGFPLRHKGVGRNQYNFIVERMITKLSGWKTKFLSCAGRSVLVKSVMEAILSYMMQGAALPMHVCEKIDKGKIVKSKEEGGLGLQSARAKNIALLAKLNWRLYQEKEALWARVLINKYCSQSRRRSKDPNKLPCSPTWIAIKKGFTVFEKGIGWNLGSNSTLSFWNDKWVKGQTARELIQGPLTQREFNLSVAETTCQGSWDWRKLSFELPLDVKDMIKAIPLQIYGEKHDNLIWKGSHDGDFKLASAYKLARSESLDAQTFQGYWIWKLDTLPKIKHFLWLCFHNSVPVKKVLESRGIIHDACCPLCRNHEETILHTLRDCPVAMNFWQKFRTSQNLSNFMHLSLVDWLSTNCLDSNLIRINGIPWSIVFPLAVWNLWKHRNNMVFQNSPLNPNLHSLCMKAATEYYYCMGKGLASKRHSVIPVCWYKPQEGWFKLNSDGASLGNPGKAGRGGIIRDSCGRWIKGFMRYIDISTSIIAEFWALRDGLTLASQLGITHLAVELDAKVVVDLILPRKTPKCLYTSILNDCMYLLEKFQQTVIRHVFREANRGADSLAKGACSLSSDFVVLDAPSTLDLNVIVNSDANGLYSLRLIVNTLPFVAS
ncbi:hypothetical protein SO802_025858 [Lithocarpus litseifolius]|uniref:Reverse transcriptase domain-containing protein n=1 Tax=Lithocarpus litseifolius TaxID=425828 RepID=A0AAW2C029_9ROSI